MHREDRGPRAESWDSFHITTLGRRGISNKEDRGAAPYFYPLPCLLHCSHWGHLSVPSQGPCPSSLGLECSFSLHGWRLLIKCHLEKAFLTVLAKVPTFHPSLFLFHFLFIRELPMVRNLFTCVYMFTIWLYLHPSKIKLHKARIQTVCSLHRMCSR